MGISALSVIEVCKVLDISDIGECLYKVLQLSRHLQETEKAPTKSTATFSVPVKPPKKRKG